MFKRLRNQFIIMHMSIVVLIVVLFFCAMLLFANNGIDRKVHELLGRNPAVFIGNEMAPRRPDSPLAFAVTLEPNGEIADISSPYTMDKDFYTNAAKQAMTKKDDVGRVRAEGVSLGFRIVGNRIIFLDISRETEMFDRLVWIFFWITLPLMFIVFLASYYFANRSIKPIESAFIKQKEFVADASHELKTPLATIMTNADVLLQNSENPKRWATHIKTETGRMASLVESLLYLAKIDYADSPNFDMVDLGEILNDVLLPLEAVIHEQNVNLQVECAPGIVINGDKIQIHRLLGILIDNAIKYTSGEILISIVKIVHGAQITVRNSGKPIPREKLCSLFDRFYRVDESHQYTGGFGLGLSIAKAIVDGHKGKIICSSDEVDGTKFIVKITD